MKISVIVAAYNEEPVIMSTVEKLLSYMKDQFKSDWELIFVNDGSKDKTGEILDSALVLDGRIKVLHHPRNFGQGRALRTGFDYCRGDVIVTMDADLSYGPGYIGGLLEALKKNNVEISLASAYMPGGTVTNVPFHRYFLSKWGNRYLAIMSHYDIATSTCVVRAYKREVIDSLFLSSDGMELQLEILMKAASAGYRVCEIPADLAWPDTKAVTREKRRSSKMKIAKTIGLYLKIGWLSKPSFMFLAAGAMFLSGGLYMAMLIMFRTFLAIWAVHAQKPFLESISMGISQTYAQYTYSFAISSGLMIFGLQLLMFGLIFIQNKFYYEELFKGMQDIYIKTKAASARPQDRD